MNPKLRQVLTTWAAVYPIITALISLLEPLLNEWPVPARTLLLSGIMVPVMVFWAVPAMTRLVAAATRFNQDLLHKPKP